MPKNNKTNSDPHVSIMRAKPSSRMEFFRGLEPAEQSQLILKLPRRVQAELLGGLSVEEAVVCLHYLSPSDVTDVLQRLETKRQVRILAALSEEIKSKVEFLLKFDPRTAAGMMSLDYIEVDNHATFAEAADLLKRHEKQTGKFPTVLVLEGVKLLGEVPGHEFALHRSSDKVAKAVKRVTKIKYNSDEKEVMSHLQQREHGKLVVLDEDGSILGVIYADDVLRAIGRGSNKQLYSFAGVHEEEDALDPPMVKVKHRYKWLIINLGTAFLAASVVGMFDEVISKFVLLAVYMPIVAGMGGNAGTQTLAVAIRGLALKEVSLGHGRRMITNEVAAGAANGAINGVIVAVVATIWNQSPKLGLVLAIAMVVNLIIAGFFGALIPLIMQRLGKDPATSATIFITTATDVFGFFVFLSLAQAIL